MKRIVMGLIVALSAVVVLSSAASYPTAIKSFTTRVAGDTIQPGHVNDLQDEVTAVETDLLKAWTSVSYSAGNFTADSGTWTVDSGDQTTLRYHKIGKRMTVAFTIASTDVSTTPTTLSITIPGGFTASARMDIPVYFSDAGTAAIGLAFVEASGTVINIRKVTGTFSATSSDNTAVFGQITFETTT